MVWLGGSSEQGSPTEGGFYGLDEPCDMPVVLEEEVVPSVEPGSPFLDPPASPPVVGIPSEAMTSSA
ncbi:hypothetical protein LIER_33734 [Lithospermum erythrorhizon]|uniref:Uncharacterized protein n=1 Tax=Lithospermum erythrorhizon TaxID=34254 RepID=A0AAV3S339_LITER